MPRKLPPFLIVLFGLLLVAGRPLLDGLFGDVVSNAVDQEATKLFGKDAATIIAAHSAWVIPGLFSALLTYSAYLIGVHERKARPSSLLVDFDQTFSGHSARTRFASGDKAVFYRLLVRPPKGQVRADCHATLIDVMGAGPGYLESIWGGERLPLTWATHSGVPITSIDLRDDSGQFLDVVYVTEKTGLGFGTPGFAVPNSIQENGLQSIDGCVFVVSISDSECAAQKYMLRFMHTGPNWDDNEVVLLPLPKRRLFGLLAPR